MSSKSASQNPKVYDAVIVGSGPNGLSAGIELARAGRSVVILEANSTLGGGVRTEELTLPGFLHDTCSSVYPMALASPYFNSLSLERWGLRWIHPDVPLAHPLDGIDPINLGVTKSPLLCRSVAETAKTLGEDASAYESLMTPWVESAEVLFKEILKPLHFSKHPLLLAKFGLIGLSSAKSFVDKHFTGHRAKALFGGIAAHSFLPLSQRPSSAIGMTLAIAGHAVGWPIVAGGAQRLTDALEACFKSFGGEIRTPFPVRTLEDLPKSRCVLFDLTPKPLLKIASNSFSKGYLKGLKSFQGGPGVFKLDWALSAPIPWKDASCLRAGTVHLGNTFDEIEQSEQAVWSGVASQRPFILLSQPSLFDPDRAPAGKHVVWAYCHVAQGSTQDHSEQIEAQIERFAPGFKNLIIARSVLDPRQIEDRNANYTEGDISGGIASLKQLFFRPTVKLKPYSTSVPGWYICSASTPPGAGVHGMCGFYAAQAAMQDGY